MRKSTLVALVCAAVVPAAALGKAPTRAHVREYRHDRRLVVREFGRRAPGRNIVRDGLPHRAASDRDVVRSIRVLERMLTPAPAPAPVVVPVWQAGNGSATVPAVVSTSSSGSGGLPACASESGSNYSTGPANTNPSSGATGRYQIIPSTAKGYGCDLSTPAGQDACAQTIYQHQGSGAWVGCGG